MPALKWYMLHRLLGNQNRYQLLESQNRYQLLGNQNRYQLLESQNPLEQQRRIFHLCTRTRSRNCHSMCKMHPPEDCRCSSNRRYSLCLHMPALKWYMLHRLQWEQEPSRRWWYNWNQIHMNKTCYLCKPSSNILDTLVSHKVPNTT